MNLNVMFSLESHHRGASNGYTQHTIIVYSNTPRLYSQWLNSVIYSATNLWAEARDAIWRRSDVILTLY